MQISIDNVISIIISILGSSVITLILSTFIFQPLQDKKKYVFEEKKRVYEFIYSLFFLKNILFLILQWLKNKCGQNQRYYRRT